MARYVRAIDHPGSFAAVAASVLFGQLGFYLTASALPLYLVHNGASQERVDSTSGRATSPR